MWNDVVWLGLSVSSLWVPGYVRPSMDEDEDKIQNNGSSVM